MNPVENAAADWNVIVTLPEATFREARNFAAMGQDPPQQLFSRVDAER